MSIKSDKWIKSKCMLPLGYLSFLTPFPALGQPGGVESLKSTEQGYRVTEVVYGDPFTDLKEAQAAVLKKNNAIDGTEIFTLTGDYEVENFKPMIEPFLPMQVRTLGHDRHLKMLAMPSTTSKENLEKLSADFDGDEEFENTKIISKGLTSFGYDVTLADEAAIFTNLNGTVIDPLNFVEESLIRVIAKDGYFILPPNSYMLGYTREYFRMPRDVLAMALGKSTYARAGAIVNVTPIEPGFEGTVVVEIANATSLPMKIYVDQGIAQFLFFQSDEECETSYADRNGGGGGKYQGQRGLVLPKG